MSPRTRWAASVGGLVRTTREPLISATVIPSRVSERDGHWRVVGEPTEGALRTLAAKAGVDIASLTRRAVVLFESEHERTATLDEPEDGQRYIHANDAPDRILDRCVAELAADGPSRTPTACAGRRAATGAGRPRRTLPERPRRRPGAGRDGRHPRPATPRGHRHTHRQRTRRRLRRASARHCPALRRPHLPQPRAQAAPRPVPASQRQHSISRPRPPTLVPRTPRSGRSSRSAATRRSAAGAATAA